MKQTAVTRSISILRITAGLIAATVSALSISVVRADDALSGATSSDSRYFQNWFERASETQAEQPHWVTPLVTVTPRLEQELRYDQAWQSLPGGHTLYNYGNNKGLELIPFEKVEVIIGVPAYQTEFADPHKYGWTDETFLVKYRILSANEKEGNYILSAFMGLSVPSGSDVFTSHHFIYTPTIAGGKGWGNFDFQSTLGVSIPDGNGRDPKGPGMTIPFNTALQYHVSKYLWPEVEANYTWWADGKREGFNQLFITPGILFGRFPIYNRVGVTFGAGVQVAVTDKPTSHRNIILSGRMPF